MNKQNILKVSLIALVVVASVLYFNINNSSINPEDNTAAAVESKSTVKSFFNRLFGISPTKTDVPGTTTTVNQGSVNYSPVPSPEQIIKCQDFNTSTMKCDYACGGTIVTLADGRQACTKPWSCRCVTNLGATIYQNMYQ